MKENTDAETIHLLIKRRSAGYVVITIKQK